MSVTLVSLMSVAQAVSRWEHGQTDSGVGDTSNLLRGRLSYSYQLFAERWRFPCRTVSYRSQPIQIHLEKWPPERCVLDSRGGHNQLVRTCAQHVRYTEHDESTSAQWTRTLLHVSVQNVQTCQVYNCNYFCFSYLLSFLRSSPQLHIRVIRAR